MNKLTLMLAVAGLMLANHAAAQVAVRSAPPDPAIASADPTPICTDRPSKATSACTVPDGRFQFESDLMNWTRDSNSGVRTDTLLFTSPLLKYGIGGSTDIEAGITPYETIRTRDAAGLRTLRGVGDLTLRVKQRFGARDAKLLFAIEPMLKIPTARIGIGNGRVEGGLIGTGVWTLPKGLSLTVSPEIDLLANDSGSGRHAQLVGAVNVGQALSSKLTASAELWTARNDDPEGTTVQYSADVALAYQAKPTLQFDAGANIGLNRATPDVQAYAGVSTRF